MADTFDVDAMIQRFRDRAAAVKRRDLPPVGGEERQRFIEQAQLDFQDYAIIADAEATLVDGILTLTVDLAAMADQRFDRAIAAIDAANSDDPNTIVVDGVKCPKELAHAELMTKWVRALDPDASPAQLLAARAHHIRRWSIPRTHYPEGRAGYLRWRSRLSKFHAEAAAEILSQVGFDDQTVDRVGDMITKKGLTSDAQVQTHEDALCLVFLETQFADLAERLGPEKTVGVVAKTIAKMSPQALEAAGGLPLSDDEARVLAAALDVVATRGSRGPS